MERNAFVQVASVAQSAVRRRALVSQSLALEWLKQSEGAATFLQARSHSTVCAQR
jgi:hypothetical protein